MKEHIFTVPDPVFFNQSVFRQISCRSRSGVMLCSQLGQRLHSVTQLILLISAHYNYYYYNKQNAVEEPIANHIKKKKKQAWIHNEKKR